IAGALAAASRICPADLVIELLYQTVPRRDRVGQPAPEVLVLAAVEIADRDTLLFNPGVIAEIEDALTLGISEFEHMVVGNAAEIATEELASVDLVEALPIMSITIGLTFAMVQRGAVGCHCHDDVVCAVVEVPRQLDRRDDISEAGKANIVEHLHESAIELARHFDYGAND